MSLNFVNVHLHQVSLAEHQVNTRVRTPEVRNKYVFVLVHGVHTHQGPLFFLAVNRVDIKQRKRLRGKVSRLNLNAQSFLHVAAKLLFTQL